jgi:hypothetical protein
MKQLVVLALALCSIQSRACAGTELYVPQWKLNQSWTVEADPPPMRTDKRNPWDAGHKPANAPTPRWIFTVDRMKDVKGRRLMSVKVRSDNPKEKTAAELVFIGNLGAGGHLESLFLYAAEFHFPSGDALVKSRVDYAKASSAPFPVLCDMTPIPCDFPFLHPATMRPPSAAADGLWREFNVTTVSDHDRRNASVRQTIIFNPGKLRFGEVVRVTADASKNQDIYMKQLSPAGVPGLRLVFNPAFPWPIYGEGPKGRFWLTK